MSEEKIPPSLDDEELDAISNVGIVILYRPRAALRAILDTNPRYLFWVIPLLPSLVALPGGLFQTSQFLEGLNQSLEQLDFSISLQFAYLLTVAVVPLAYFSNMVHIYGFAWVYARVGKKLGGTGTRKDLECACAWSFAPLIVIRLVLLIPAFLIQPNLPSIPTEPGVPPGDAANQMIDGFLSTLPQMMFFGMLSTVLWAYALYVHVSLLAEAHRFSTGSGVLLFIITFILYILALVVMTIGGFVLAMALLFFTGALG
jgi:hypothetical protein